MQRLVEGIRLAPAPPGRVFLAADSLFSDCCVYIKVKGCVVYGLSEENFVLPKTGSLSFRYNS